jgi:beta-lactam-binding protein with PASTA domain
MWRGLARRSLPYLITATGGFVLAYLLVAFVIFPARLIPSDRKVPNVIGMPHEDAVRRLQGDGFRASTRDQRFSTAAPAGTVLEQSPAPGTEAPRGETVALDVSRGQRQGEVPPLLGLTVAQAEQLLENEGLNLGEVTEREDVAPRGQVIASSPPTATRVPVPSVVTLVVSSGPKLVELPDIVGQSGSQARSLLQQLGFRVAMQVDSFSSMPAGTVVDQDPAGGRSVRAGSRVTLTVSGAAP